MLNCTFIVAMIITGLRLRCHHAHLSTGGVVLVLMVPFRPISEGDNSGAAIPMVVVVTEEVWAGLMEEGLGVDPMALGVIGAGLGVRVVMVMEGILEAIKEVVTEEATDELAG